MLRQTFACVLVMATTILQQHAPAAEPAGPLNIAWAKNYLTIDHERLAGPISINYLEAYCRAGSNDRDWGKTVIRHKARLVSQTETPSGRHIKLEDVLADGVVVKHTITASHDAVEFQLVAHNPTDTASEAHWAQPCIRVDKFTGTSRSDARVLVPAYARQSFLMLNGKLTMLPTKPWADKARYIPGQVYCPLGVDRNDVNPRPLSSLVPSSGLCGCFSKDRQQIMAIAWEPYQEIFQGVIICIHNDFRIGGLKPGETKHIRGKLYLVDANVEKLLARFRSDFPEQTPKK